MTTGTQVSRRNPTYTKYANHRLLIQNPKRVPAAVAYTQLIMGNRKKKMNPSPKLQFLIRSAFSRIIPSGSTNSPKLNIKAFQKHRVTICPGEPTSASGCRFICCTVVSVTCTPAKEMPSASTAQNSNARILNSGVLASINASTPNAVNHNQYESALCIVGCMCIFCQLKVVFIVYFIQIFPLCQAEFRAAFKAIQFSHGFNLLIAFIVGIIS